MANPTLPQCAIREAIDSLSHVQGTLTCAVKVLDEQQTGSPLWEVSEAVHGAISMIQRAYCTLNDRNVAIVITEGGR